MGITPSRTSKFPKSISKKMKSSIEKCGASSDLDPQVHGQDSLAHSARVPAITNIKSDEARCAEAAEPVLVAKGLTKQAEGVCSDRHHFPRLNSVDALQPSTILPTETKGKTGLKSNNEVPPDSTQVRPTHLKVSPRTLENSKGTNPLKLEEERKSEKLKHFSMICSQIIPSIYVGGKAVAGNRKKLEENNITYILNTSFTHCPNFFEEEKDSFTYRSFRLYDSKEEEIIWFIYQAFDFIEEARQKGTNILVHCIEGVSRSCTICIAYLMWSKAMSYEQAFDHVREQRGVCSPNIGFVCQLLEWQKIRKQKPQFPILFRLSPHGIHDAQTLVVKLCRDARSRELIPASAKCLDPRGIFVIWPQVSACLYIWKGNQHTDSQSKFLEDAVRWLQQYENAPKEIRIVIQGDEPQEFWDALDGDPEDSERKSIFGDLSLVQISNSPRDGTESVIAGDALIEHKPVLHQFRKDEDGSFALESLGVYDDEDLNSTALFILTAGEGSEVSYIWVGSECAFEEISSLQSNQEIISYLQQHASNAIGNHTNLECVRQGQESEGFWVAFEAGF
mmetsp:Transcript_39511/g.50998  ORF Transcript_39511/g.50998 Transcript_39511/m.50998 type:complete len:563 (+) Transcript_39511:444-2132(+)|eukprot:CAMPEP_0117759540 /NCGR_PEP_ID=MMETSP0947-20121206/16073_1 /TAXON_ID=44440 /ORGANISM="Chattonella subsalsa, Strain CCMP2191" /LENGTH=562 /DNA_ID=CAMNT_0005580015 /DNA_START=431 /DNA_END=2119 /DNA_ORIENTATION=+